MNKYKKTEPTLFYRKAMLDMKRVRDELKEHRYFLERSVERRTDHLSRRIALLESCNATLCDKLSTAYKEIVALKKKSTSDQPDKEAVKDDGNVKLYLVNNQALKQYEASVQKKSSEHVTSIRSRMPPYLNANVLNLKLTQPEEVEHVLMEMAGADRQMDTPARFE